MLESEVSKSAIKVDLYGTPISPSEIELRVKHLKSVYKDYLNYILASIVLAMGVTFRAISLEYDHIIELCKVGLNVGMWIGLFTGFMISGNGLRRLHLITVSIVLSTAASLLASMSMTLALGYVTEWVTSLNILASALACMWMLTYYDEVVIGLDSLQVVNQSENRFVEKAASYFEDLDSFRQKILAQGRLPLAGEYWAIRDWVDEKKN